MRPAMVLLLIYSAFSALWAAAGDITVPFRNLSEWTEKSFKGHTTYTLVKEAGREVLHAETSGNASGLFRKIAVDSREFPVIRWRWKVSRTLAAEAAQHKSGDDFAARVYVIFPGRFFWQTRALVYVYSDKLPVGTVLPNAFTANAAIIVLESGNGHAGEWRDEARNYREDYRGYFKEASPDPEAVAVMTDGDNTGSHAEAWYDAIRLARQ